MARLSKADFLLATALTGVGAVMPLASCATSGATQHDTSSKQRITNEPTVATTLQMLAEAMSWADVNYVADKDEYRVFTQGPNSPSFSVPRHYAGDNIFETANNGYLTHIVIPSLEQYATIPVGELDPLSPEYKPDVGASVLAEALASPDMRYFRTPEGNQYGRQIPEASISLINVLDAPYSLFRYVEQLEEGRSLQDVKAELRADLTSQAIIWLADHNADIWAYKSIPQAEEGDTDLYVWVPVPYENGSPVRRGMMRFRVFGFGVTDPKIDAQK